MRDAIVLPDNHTLTTEEIEQIKEDRWTTWLAFITTPAVPPDYVLDEFGNVLFDENGAPIIKESADG